MSKMDTWFRKHDPRKPKDPSQLFVFRDGFPMVVLRPADAEKKVAAVKVITEGMPHKEASRLLDEALNDQPHQFIGYLSKSKAGDIVDAWGRVKFNVQPGDSFCSGPEFAPPMFMRTGHFHKEVWDGRTVLVLPNPALTVDSNTGIVLESCDPAERAAILLRGGVTEIDCHIPTLNRLMTGDPNKDWRESTHVA